MVSSRTDRKAVFSNFSAPSAERAPQNSVPSSLMEKKGTQLVSSDGATNQIQVNQSIASLEELLSSLVKSLEPLPNSLSFLQRGQQSIANMIGGSSNSTTNLSKTEPIQTPPSKEQQIVESLLHLVQSTNSIKEKLGIKEKKHTEPSKLSPTQLALVIGLGLASSLFTLNIFFMERLTTEFKDLQQYLRSPKQEQAKPGRKQ